MKIEDAVQLYIKLRDKKSDMKKAYDASVEAVDTKMQTIEAALLKHFHEVGQENAKTKYGTAYITRRLNASVSDRAIFLSFVLENNALEFIESKANTTAVKDYMEEHEAPPPGVKVSVTQKININRSK